MVTGILSGQEIPLLIDTGSSHSVLRRIPVATPIYPTTWETGRRGTGIINRNLDQPIDEKAEQESEGKPKEKPENEGNGKKIYENEPRKYLDKIDGQTDNETGNKMDKQSNKRWTGPESTEGNGPAQYSDAEPDQLEEKDPASLQKLKNTSKHGSMQTLAEPEENQS
mmetsp:Transcript_19453/g.28246  ORF Transcript_19453/g.28246 Transcript_19453/m.28246 type:complete len:167 (-) Transcript_19453:355-855(-)